MFWSAESEHPRLTSPLKVFRENSKLCDRNPPTFLTDRQTDRRTDRQTTCDPKTALCTKVHRAVKMTKPYIDDITITYQSTVVFNILVHNPVDKPGLRAYCCYCCNFTQGHRFQQLRYIAIVLLSTLDRSFILYLINGTL